MAVMTLPASKILYIAGCYSLLVIYILSSSTIVTLVLTGIILHMSVHYLHSQTGWQFGVVVAHWSRSTKLLYAGPG